MWIVSACHANLSDYTAFVNFTKEDFVTEAFVVFNHSGRTMQLCFLVNEDDKADVRQWFPGHVVNHYDDNSSELDQPLSIEACMLIAVSNCQLFR